MKTVADTSAQVDQMRETWPMVDALLGGTLAMRKAGKAFLPKWPQEEDESYKVRLNNSVLHPVFSRTIRIMAAKPFIQKMVIKPEFPSRLSAIESDCDLHGTGINEFFADRFSECLSHGLCGVLADYKGDGAKTLLEEKESGARPYLCAYAPQSILGWRYENNQLIQIRLMESISEPDGEWGEKNIDQVRVLEIGSWKTYRKNQKEEWVVHQDGETTLDEIPFTFFYGDKQSFGVGYSPLIDLAFQNVEHWQSCSDQQSILHVARVPILFAKMFGKNDIAIGAGVAAKAEDEHASLTYVEHSGQAIEAGANSISQLEERMLHAGAELLKRKAGTITATQVLSEGEANRSTLQNIAIEFEEAVEQCLKYLAKWIKVDFDPEVSLYKDFSVGASDGDIDHIMAACEMGVLPKEKVLSEMIRRNIVVPDEVDEKCKTT